MEEDIIEEVNEELTDTSEVEEVENQEIKTYSEEEVEELKAQLKAEYEEKFDSKFNKRWARESSKLERKYAEQDELIQLYMEQTGAKDLSELAENSYRQYGIEKPKKSNSKDEEILGKYDAKEILELDDEMIEEEANRLAGITNRTAREQATFMELGSYLTNKKSEQKRKQEFKENGIDEELQNNQEFNDFINKFNDKTPLSDIYKLYEQTHQTTVKKPFSAGSAKGNKAKKDEEYFTPEEYEALTDKDLDNPKVYEKAMKTMRHFYNS